MSFPERRRDRSLDAVRHLFRYGLHVDPGEIVDVDETPHRGRHGNQHELVLVAAVIDALLARDSDDAERDAVDGDDLPNGRLTAKQRLDHHRSHDGDPASLRLVVAIEEAPGGDGEVARSSEGLRGAEDPHGYRVTAPLGEQRAFDDGRRPQHSRYVPRQSPPVLDAKVRPFRSFTA